MCDHHHRVRVDKNTCLCVQCEAYFNNDWSKLLDAPRNWRAMDADELVIWYARVKIGAKI